MALETLVFGKSWTSAADFPTYESDEAKVRADMQYHPDAIRTYINEKLVALLNSTAGASNITAADGQSIQDNLNQLVQDIQALAGGTIPDQGDALGWDLDAGGHRVKNLGAPTQDTDAVRRSFILTAALLARYGLAEGSTAVDLFNAAADRMDVMHPKDFEWKLIATLETPGSGTFTAPDLFDGDGYEIGYYMIGGGGSGAAAVASSQGAAAGAGASGCGLCGTKDVEPGDEIAWTVGSGGVAVTATSSSSYAGQNGNAGGDTVFDGKTAKGGGGGKALSVPNLGSTIADELKAAIGNSGGQASDDVLGMNFFTDRCGGTPPVDVTYQVSTASSTSDDHTKNEVTGSARKSFQPGRVGQNMFDPGMVTLCCGGFAYVGYYYYYAQIIPPDTD